MKPFRKFSINQIIVISAMFTVVFANSALFRNLDQAFGDAPSGYLHIASLGVVLFSITTLLLALLSMTRAVRPVLAVYFLLTAACAYFMDTYNVIIDHDMIANVAQTDPAEARDLITLRLALYIGLIGVLPVVLLWTIDIKTENWRTALKNRGVLVTGALLLAGTLVLASSSFYASFIREHKSLRYYSNPAAPIQGLLRYASLQFQTTDDPLKTVGEDAKTPAADTDRELVILVVGETARTDHFSINGYERETNPKLARERIASLRDVASCGTSTAVSLPCMFALSDRDDYDGDKAKNTENLLDVVQHAGVQVLWRDNNSGSKGVSDRVPSENFSAADINPVCDGECRDEGMLSGLQAFIDDHPSGDILIVLHQMGSHGPAYFKRYPTEFRQFLPTCETSQLDSCTEEEIRNAYDNTILYTDHVLSQVISLLRANDADFETAMVYVSDHGESLGEGGLYLHGLPYFIAPQSQTRVPLVFWFGQQFDGTSIAAIRQLADQPFSHDHLFHTLLGMFEIDTTIYDRNRDIFRLARDVEKLPTEYQ